MCSASEAAAAPTLRQSRRTPGSDSEALAWALCFRNPSCPPLSFEIWIATFAGAMLSACPHERRRSVEIHEAPCDFSPVGRNTQSNRLTASQGLVVMEFRRPQDVASAWAPVFRLPPYAEPLCKSPCHRVSEIASCSPEGHNERDGKCA